MHFLRIRHSFLCPLPLINRRPSHYSSYFFRLCIDKRTQWIFSHQPLVLFARQLLWLHLGRLIVVTLIQPRLNSRWLLWFPRIVWRFRRWIPSTSSFFLLLMISLIHRIQTFGWTRHTWWGLAYWCWSYFLAWLASHGASGLVSWWSRSVSVAAAEFANRNSSWPWTPRPAVVPTFVQTSPGRSVNGTTNMSVLR